MPDPAAEPQERTAVFPVDEDGTAGCGPTVSPEVAPQQEPRPAEVMAARAPDAIIGQTLDGTILSWNVGAERLYGYAAGEITGRSISLLTALHRSDELQQLLEPVRRGQTLAHHETIHRRKDGTPVLVVLIVSPIRDAGGEVVGASVIARDITGQMPSEGALRLSAAEVLRPLTELRYVTSHARCLLWHGTVTDQGHGPGTYHWDTQVFDEAAAQAFMPLDLLPGERYTSAWYRHRMPEGQRLTNRLSDEALHANRPSYGAEFGCRGKDGQVRWFDERVYVEPLPPPTGACGFWRVVGVAIDVTERQRAQAELRASEEELRQANQAKDEFLAMLAHELRNPLGAISNAVAVMDRSLPDAPAYQHALEVVKRQIQLQTRIVSDLLDVSRITRGSLPLQRDRLDLVRLCRQAAEDLRPALHAAALDFSLDLPEAPVWVAGDPARLTQVLVNLLDNAIKFTEAGGQITVRCSVSGAQGSKGVSLPANIEPRAPDTEYGVVAVSDTGMGIAPELLPHVFDVFTQAEQTLARSRGGLGLGLALVNGLVQQHGGAVTAHSEGPGHGATFTVWLPLEVDG